MFSKLLLLIVPAATYDVLLRVLLCLLCFTVLPYNYCEAYKTSFAVPWPVAAKSSRLWRGPVPWLAFIVSRCYLRFIWVLKSFLSPIVVTVSFLWIRISLDTLFVRKAGNYTKSMSFTSSLIKFCLVIEFTGAASLKSEPIIPTPRFAVACGSDDFLIKPVVIYI